MAERFALPYLWASGYGMSFLVKSGAAGRFWRQAITLLRRRADAQTRRRADAQTRRRADAQTRRRADAQTRRRADAQTRRRADAQILPDKLFAAKPRKTQFTAVLILR